MSYSMSLGNGGLSFRTSTTKTSTDVPSMESPQDCSSSSSPSPSNSTGTTPSAVLNSSTDSPPSERSLTNIINIHPDEPVKRPTLSNIKRPTSKSLYEYDKVRKAQTTTTLLKLMSYITPSNSNSTNTNTANTTASSSDSSVATRSNTLTSSSGSGSGDGTTASAGGSPLSAGDPDTPNPPAPPPPIRLLKRPKYNSTETMFIRSFLLAPDTDEIVYCMARAVLLKLRENENVEDKVYLRVFDERHRKLFEPYYDLTPSFKEVHEFLVELFAARDISAECGVMAVVYVDRLFAETSVTFDKTNWRPIVFMAVLLASKTWEDANVWNADYTGIFDGLEVEAINTLEREFLCRIQFNLVLTPSTYTRYYFDLRSLASISDDTFPVKPLDKKVAAQLEAKTIGAQEKARISLIHAVRSPSLDSFVGGNATVSMADFRRRVDISNKFV